MPMIFRRGAALCLLLTCLPAAYASDDDTRHLLERTRRATEQRVRQFGEPVAPPGAVVHEGKIYEVQTNLQDLEPAIYIALNTGQWERLVEFVGRYRLLRDHRPALVDMAEGLLARQAGAIALAVRRLQAAHAADPEDARIRLELARLLFEDNRDAEARAMFEQVQRGMLPDYGRMQTQQYLSALGARAGWHGGVAVGTGYDSNINQANGARTCLSRFLSLCLNDRKMPDPIGSSLVNYELVLERRDNLAGNHNLLLRPISYGTYYRRGDADASSLVRNYSSATSVLYLGYQYLDARNNISLLPYVEHYFRDGYTYYLAGGLQWEWRRSLARKWQMSVLLDARRFRYRARARFINSDYSQYQAGLSVSYLPRASTSITAGVDVVRKAFALKPASGKEVVLRAGVFHAFRGKPGFYLNAQGIFRIGRNDAYDGFLGGRRGDRLQVYLVTLGAEGWKIGGMTPELRLRRSINRSNPDWAYNYAQNEVGLTLRRVF